jgi:hypothetical protein
MLKAAQLRRYHHAVPRIPNHKNMGKSNRHLRANKKMENGRSMITIHMPHPPNNDGPKL